MRWARSQSWERRQVELCRWWAQAEVWDGGVRGDNAVEDVIRKQLVEQQQERKKLKHQTWWKPNEHDELLHG